MPIQTFLTDHAEFEPEAIETMSKALEETCQALHVDGKPKGRQVIAARIIDLARNGITDVAALRDRVVAETKAMQRL